MADALQRELSYAGVRFAASFDLVDDADADPAHSEGVKGAENVEGAKAPTPLHRRPLNRRLPHRRLPRKRVRPT